MASVTNNTARKTFKVSKKGSCYDVECVLCGVEFKAWDWLRNALTRGYAHSYTTHGVDSPRGLKAAQWHRTSDIKLRDTK